MKYEGNFDNDLKNGEGILLYFNGEKYEGEFFKIKFMEKGLSIELIMK